MGATMKSLETQIGKLANALIDHNRGHFTSNTEVSPLEYCKAIELRSGKEVRVSEFNSKVETEKKGEEAEVGESKHMESKDEPKQKPMFKTKLPYPQRFKKKVLDEQFAKFLDIISTFNSPMFLQKMPNFAKFLKEMMSRKRKLEEFETVNLIEKCSAIL
ncbi:uncharacterized protein [Henckelia pumila]|uniref:uncharacterized protein n=1 Tax=Henckelia pumila TaxID=405737 RepID=UPI003C6E6581